jgi:hypothetical protein
MKPDINEREAIVKYLKQCSDVMVCPPVGEKRYTGNSVTELIDKVIERCISAIAKGIENGEHLRGNK